MLKRSIGLVCCICIVVLFASCTTGVIKPDPESPLFMTWLIEQAEQRWKAAFPEEGFWGLWQAAGTAEGFVDTTQRGGKSSGDILNWEFWFASGEDVGSKTGVIVWDDGEWQEPELVDDYVIEEVLFRDSDLVKVQFDLDQAIMMLRTSGYVGENDWFSHVVFWRPLIMEPGEPYYVFTISPGVFIAIGSITGSVEEFYL